MFLNRFFFLEKGAFKMGGGGGGERADVDEVQGKKGQRCIAFLAALPVHGDYESTRVHESNGGTKN